MSAVDATSYIDKEYDRLISEAGAATDDVSSILSKKYWATLGKGGHAFSFSVRKRPEGGVDEHYSVDHASPNLITRALTPIYGVFQGKKDRSLVYSLGRLHEAIEVDEFKNNILPILKAHMGEGPKPSIDRGFMVNGHISPAVVMRESNMVNKIGHHDALSHLFRYRRRHDEPVLLQLTGKKYGEEFSEQDLEKARRLYDRPLTS